MNANAGFRRLALAATGISLASIPPALGESAPIPLDQLGAVATRQAEDDGLAVTATESGARLRCAFQRLEAEATPDGLWLRSTGEEADDEPFRLVAVSVGRENVAHPTSDVQPPGTSWARTASGEPLWGSAGRVRPLTTGVASRRGSDTRRTDKTQTCLVPTGSSGDLDEIRPTGRVVIDGDLVRFLRPGLIEEYSVSVDGVRQDFVIAAPPSGDGDLCVELAVSGAEAEAAPDAARLRLAGSGRSLAYSQLRASDATGRKLAARMEVHWPDRLVVRVEDEGAEYPVRIDPTFSDADWVSLNPGVQGTDRGVVVMAVDTNGLVYVGGAFSVAGTVAANHIAKWDGSQWSALGSGTDRTVLDLALIGTNLYAGGWFHSAGGVAANHIARWDGSQWSALGSGTSSEVNALAVIGTELYAGGYFQSAGGVSANYIAKWDGSQWSALGSGTAGAVWALAAIETNLYAAGEFSSAGGVPANHIAKWDGSGWSALGPGFNRFIVALAVMGTDLYAGGYSTIARWNGSQWTSLASGIGDPGIVNSLAVSGPYLYAAGWFSSIGGVPAANIARWNRSSWSALRGGVDYGVNALAISGSDLYVGGEFSSVDGSAVRHIAKWDGTQWSALGSSLPTGDWITFGALAANENDVYVAIRHTDSIWQDNSAIATIEKWGGDALSPVWSVQRAPGDAYVYAMILAGTDLYIGGIFTSVNGVPANNIAKWNGSSWSALGSGVNGEVYSLAIDGTDLYAGGYFTSAGGVQANRVAKWNGSTWSALGSGMNDVVLALSVVGTDLYAGGFFATAGGRTANKIARWNGSGWSALGSGINDGFVWALATWGANLYVAGLFTTAGGVPVNSIAVWDGAAWSALGSGIDAYNLGIHALAVNGTDVYAGGQMSSAGGVPVNGIAWWDGSTWSPLGSGVSGTADPQIGGMVEELAIDGNGHLFVGGGFSTAGGKVSPFIAQANITGLDLVWEVVPSPQAAGVPILVALSARNAAGDLLGSHGDPVTLSGYAPVVAVTNITLDAGTATWGYPMYSRFHDARTQVIYPAGKLGRACTITSLALEVAALPGQTLKSWTIRLKHTTLSEFPSSPNWEAEGWAGGLQTDLDPGAVGWRIFELSAPFEYNGVDNLLVDFSFNNASYSSEGHVRATDVDAYRSITYATDSAYGDPMNWSGLTPTPVRSRMVPNLVLGAGYPDTVSVSVTPATTGPFVDGIWTGEVTIAEAYSGVILRADDGLGHTGESNPFEVEAAVVDTDGDGLADEWELAWFPSLTHVAFQSDWDGDGFRDGFECVAGTSPVDPGSFLGITSVELNAAGTEAVIRWSSVSNKLYSVYCTSNVIEGVGVLLDGHLPATPPENVYTDTVDGVENRSYGVEVER